MTARKVRRAMAPITASVLALALAGCASVVGVSDAPTGTIGGAIQPARAAAIAAQVIGNATSVAKTPGPEGDALRAATYTGDALTAVQADAKLASAAPETPPDAQALTPAAPVVLAVSRGLDYPRSMVVQTTLAKSGLPVLYLLSTPDVRTPYKIAASAPMLPSAQVKGFDPIAQGSPGLGDGAGLAVRPEELVGRYGAALAFPPPAPVPAQPFAEDSFAAGIKLGAASQSQGLAGSVAFTQQHAPKDVAGGLRVAKAAGALVFAVLDRSDVFVNKSTQPFAPPARFTALTGVGEVKAEATLRTLEFVVFFIPASGPAVAVGAREHLYAASGA